MRPIRTALAAGVLLAGLAAVSTTADAAPGAGAPATIRVARAGTTNLAAANTNQDPSGGVLGAERTGPKRKGSDPLRTEPGDGAPALPAGQGTPTSGASRTKSQPSLVTSWEGVNHRDSRLAFGGNQFSGEPADQGLCVGNGYVLESVNSALQVFDTAGTALTDPIALNELYGFPPAINRTTGVYGPFTFDISCHYDAQSGRWFHLAVDLDQDPVTGDFTGKNYLDLAVSKTGDPTGDWFVYRIPGMNDGTEGTPDHGCPGGPCFADFPHLGVDRDGVYITTNEFPLFADGFIGAQVYALPKAPLVAGASTFDLTLFNTADDPVRPGEPGFTLWPAQAAGTQFDAGQRGTQWFVSSTAVFDDTSGDSEDLVVWALTNTRSLSSGSPAVRLSKVVTPSQRYAVPPASVQKPGTIPLGELDYGATEPGLIDTSDSRVLDARFANGKLWAVLGTAASVDGNQTAGVGWFVLQASANANGVNARVSRQGILALADESLAYPTLGVTTSGRGVIGFTRVGPGLHPSAGYASIDAVRGAGPVAMAAEGRAPQDGFTEYGDRPRWGDYGAAAVDGSTIWVANQYIEQPPCTVDEFVATGFSCGGFRTRLANWSTRVTAFRV